MKVAAGVTHIKKDGPYLPASVINPGCTKLPRTAVVIQPTLCHYTCQITPVKLEQGQGTKRALTPDLNPQKYSVLSVSGKTRQYGRKF